MFSGIRLNYLPTDKLNLSLYLMNAYNDFEDNNRKKSIGLYANYIFSENCSVTYCNYLGDDTPEEADSIGHYRFYQNAYINYNIRKLSLQLGVDFCLQQNSDLVQADKTASLFGGIAIAKYAFTDKFSLYGRYELFNDENAILSTPFVDQQSKLTGYKSWGVTAGIEILPFNNLFIRFETRKLVFDEDQDIFYWNSKFTNKRWEATVNMGYTF